MNEKRPGAVAALARFRHAREELADRREQPGVGRRIGARRAADRALVDVDDLVEELEAVDRFVRRRLGGAAVELARDRVVQRVVDERRLARARHAGHADEQAHRQLDRDVLQVVAASRRRSSSCRFGSARWRSAGIVDAAPAARGTGRSAIRRARAMSLRRALRDDVAAVLAGARGPCRRRNRRS